MKSNQTTIPGSADLKAIRGALNSAESAKLFVVADDQTVLGTLTLPDLPDQDPGGPLTAGHIARPNPPLLQGSDDIGEALRLMDESGEIYIGVVDNLESLKLIGSIHQTDIIVTYNQALLKKRDEDRD